MEIVRNPGRDKLQQDRCRLVCQEAGLRRDQIVDAVGLGKSRVPVNEGEEQQRRADEEASECERQPECRCAEKVNRVHEA